MTNEDDLTRELIQRLDQAGRPTARERTRMRDQMWAAAASELDNSGVSIDQAELVRSSVREPRYGRRILAGALAVILLVAGIWVTVIRTEEPGVVEQTDIPEDSVPTTASTSVATTTTTQPPTTAEPTTTAPAVIDARTQELLDRFEATYNAGDPDEFLALLQPGMDREVVVDRDRRLYAQEYLRELYLVDAALHTEITLECEPRGGSPTITCVPTRYDDLHRILGIPGTEDYDWLLVFDEDGLVRSWSERRENQPNVDNYEREALKPFADWTFENHPDVVGGGLRPAVAAEWIVEKRDDIVAMVALFAESRGVTLPE